MCRCGSVLYRYDWFGGPCDRVDVASVCDSDSSAHLEAGTYLVIRGSVVSWSVFA